MKNIVIKGLLAGTILLVINFIALFVIIWFMPGLAKEYYSPVFNMEGYKGGLYFLHPYIVSFALAWFWLRFKIILKGSFWLRGLEMGLAYGVVAVLPSMWITFSAFAVSFPIVLSWFFYGLMQGIVVGVFYAKVNP